MLTTCHACRSAPARHVGAGGALCDACAAAFVASPEGRRYLSARNPVTRRIALAEFGRRRCDEIESTRQHQE